jgi:UDP-glucose 4-epimerase
MENILITGGAGFIGSALAAKLIDERGAMITVVDNLSTGSKANLASSSRLRFIKADVNRFEDISGVFFSTNFDYVFHYAAVVGVDRTLKHPVCVLDDIDGIRNVLVLCKNTGVRKVFFASSSEVYGEPVTLPQHEYATPLNSRLPYAVVKNVGESFCRAFYREYGLRYQILRFFNTYGPAQSNDFVISRFLTAALNDRDICVYGDGKQTRTFCYIDDNVDATLKLVSDAQQVRETINIGSDVCTTILELASSVLRVTGSRSRIVHLPSLPEGDMSRRQPDNFAMREVLGRPLKPLEEGLEAILRAWEGRREPSA